MIQELRSLIIWVSFQEARDQPAWCIHTIHFIVHNDTRLRYHQLTAEQQVYGGNDRDGKSGVVCSGNVGGPRPAGMQVALASLWTIHESQGGYLRF